MAGFSSGTQLADCIFGIPFFSLSERVRQAYELAIQALEKPELARQVIKMKPEI